MAFDTPLDADEELQFQAWKSQNAPNDSGEDYDLRGAFKAGLLPGADGHWADTYKKPNHPTFSDQSIYSSLTDTKPGTWVGPQHQTFQPFLHQDGATPLQDKLPETESSLPTLKPMNTANSSPGDHLSKLPALMANHVAMSALSKDPSQATLNSLIQRNLSTGAFADAAKRQGIWTR